MLVVNPHHIQPKELNGYADREGFAAVQIFKGWKRVDSLIRAIPYMDNRESKIVGGAGIEYRYMTSKDKCKDKYFNKNGDRIWDVALNSGMLYKGVMLNEKVLELMGNVKLQIDPSFSAKYAKKLLIPSPIYPTTELIVLKIFPNAVPSPEDAFKKSYI